LSAKFHITYLTYERPSTVQEIYDCSSNGNHVNEVVVLRMLDVLSADRDRQTAQTDSADRQTGRQTGKQTDRQTYRDRQTDKQRQTDRPTGRQADRQEDRQTGRQT
jgi:hypothetical protein